MDFLFKSIQFRAIMRSGVIEAEQHQNWQKLKNCTFFVPIAPPRKNLDYGIVCSRISNLVKKLLGFWSSDKNNFWKNQKMLVLSQNTEFRQKPETPVFRQKVQPS